MKLADQKNEAALIRNATFRPATAVTTPASDAPSASIADAVDDDAGDWADDRDGKELHDHHPCDGCRRSREIEEQRVHGDRVEPVAQLRDRLTDVQQAEVTVLPEQRDVWIHDRAASGFRP